MGVFYGFTICLVISACSRWRFVPFVALFCSLPCSVRWLVLFGALFPSVAFLPPSASYRRVRRSYSASGLTAAVVLQPQAVYKKKRAKIRKKIDICKF